MPLSTTCPNCKALFRLPDELAGRKVKCQKCQTLFFVPRSEAMTTMPGVAAEVPKAAKPKEERRVRTPVAPPPPYVTAAAEEHDEEPEEHEEAEERKPRRRRREPEPEPEPERPVRRRRAKSKSNALTWILVIGGISLFLCVGMSGVGAIVFFIVRDQSTTTNVTFGADGTFRSNSSLNFRSPLKDGKHVKTYTIRMEAGKAYQIDMTSDHIDSFLFVVAANGAVVAIDDDSGAGLNARIIFRPQQTGDFRIEATTFGGDDTGPFTLTVRRF